MKIAFKNWLLLFVLLVGLSSGPVCQAQTFTTLHSFTLESGDGGVPSNGANPIGGLLLSQGCIYGTTAWGGSTTNGTVFRMNLDGTGFTNLYRFSQISADGAGPNGSLVLSGNTLYGTCAAGGVGGIGTVFGLNTNGSGFTILHSFTNSDGATPLAGLILLGSNALYGTTVAGGVSGNGTVFCLNTNGSGFTNVYSFTSNGYPAAALFSLSNTLYGTTQGMYATGTVFSIHTDGTGFTTLQIDGNPRAGLVLLDNTLYGTTAESSYTGDFGTVFKINTDGTGFSVLHAFTPSFSYPQVNSDGADPEAALILFGNTLYGTCVSGGSSGNGTIFAINTDGSGFANLHNFTGGSDGAFPKGSLVLSGNTFYGTAYGGGSSGYGTVFSLSFPPQLNIVHSSSDIVLSWPTNYAGFDYSGFVLQSTTNLASPIWATNLPTPVVVNGQYTVTYPISGTQQFFRLSQ